MACGTNLFMAFLLFVSTNMQIFVRGVPQVPCYFIFGDSLVDNGNNNGLVTQAKANYRPYGIDFANMEPTGRFTNGLNQADFIGQFLGFDSFIPPFATARGSEILQGVNYASGAAGIRAETGYQLGARISLDIQLLNHRTTVMRIAVLQRNISFTRDYLSKCIYTVGMGSNDYLNNYFMPQFYPTQRRYTPDQYAEILIKQYSQQLKALYNYGARKVAVFGIGLIGCTPAVIAKNGTNGSPCVDFVNNAAQLFNNRLKPLVDDLNSLADAKFIYINITSISSGDPRAAGITVLDTTCCQVRADGQCDPNNTTPCSNRNQYVFYDAFHPTEIINFGAAARSYHAASPSDAYPIDISRLAKL